MKASTSLRFGGILSYVDAIEILEGADLQRMREACAMAAACLCEVGERLEPGMTTADIDAFVHAYITERQAYPAPLNYHGFPKSVCTSVNEVVCHGIPSTKCVLKRGDIINVDVTTRFPAEQGFHGDTSAMFYIGEPSEEAVRVVEAARKALELGIAEVRAGARLGDIGAAIQNFVEGEGLGVVRDYVGHGVGRRFHMPPQVYHYGNPGTGRRLKEGMIFTIEPMVNLGSWQCDLLDDGWTVLTKDRKLSAQFEHTLRVTRDGCEVLTARPEALSHSEDRPYAVKVPQSAPAQTPA